MRIVSRHARFTLSLSFAGFILIGLSASLMGVAWPFIRNTFNLSLDALGIQLVVSTAGFLSVSILLGRLIGWMGTGRLLLSSFILGGVGFLGYALAPSWSVLVACSFITGWGVGAVDAGLNYYSAYNQSVRTMNWLHASFGVGATIGPLLMTAILGLGYSWRLGYGVLGGLFLVVALFVALTLPAWQESDGGETVSSTPQASVVSTLKRVIVWLSILLFFVYTGLEGTAGQWTFTLFTEGRGISLALAGTWLSLFWGGLTLGRIVLGAVVDRLGVTQLLRLCMLGAIVATLGIWSQAAILNAISMVVLGFALGPIFPTLMSQTPNRVGRPFAGHTIGYQMAATSIGIALAPAFAGVLAERSSIEVIAPFLVVTAVLMFGLFEFTQFWLQKNTA